MNTLCSRKTLLASLLGLSVTPAMADLVISQYVEGSSYNKVLELYNSGTESIDLGDYKVVKYVNGNVDNPSNITLSSVSLAAGEVYVIAHVLASDELLALAQQTTGSLDFNGDDPVAIVKLSDSSTVDFFGEYGDVDFAKDATYERIDNTPIADGVWDTSLWSVQSQDYFVGIGDAPTDEEPVTEVFACASETFTPIYEIQGTGSSSPFVPDGQYTGDEVFTSGVVTSIVSDLYSGFFIQDATGDGDPLTSDGVFVYTSSVPSDLQVGDEVCLYGTVGEYYYATQVALDDDSYEILSSGNIIDPTTLSLNSDSLLHDQLEPYEGMLVTTTDSGLIVSRAFGFDYADGAYRNNMVLTYQKPIFKSSHIYEAESDADIALEADNLLSTLFIETDEDAANGVVPYFDDLNAEDGYIRVGDEITNLEGVINYSYSQYRLVVSDDLQLEKSDFIHHSDRTAYGPELSKKGNLRVASFNVLNLFNSELGGDDNPISDYRGADSQEEYELQLAKIISALTLMDADIIGLMEIENNGFGSNSAIAALVTELNNSQAANAEPYAYIDAGDYVGGDAIAVGLLYRPDVVELSGDVVKIDLPEQHGTDIYGEQFDKYQRVSLLQTFVHKKSKQSLSVVVNHFKSKGSACIEDSVETTSQSNCNEFRVSAAVTLGDYLQDNVTGNLLVIGDLNAYGQEDPIRVLTDYDPDTAERKIITSEQTYLDDVELNDGLAVEVTESYGMVNLVEHFHGGEYYSSTYDGELGALDHALANKQLLKSIVDAVDWSINAAESTLFEYSSEYTADLVKSTNAYSSSDHDPVIIEILFEKQRKYKKEKRSKYSKYHSK